MKTPWPPSRCLCSCFQTSGERAGLRHRGHGKCSSSREAPESAASPDLALETLVTLVSQGHTCSTGSVKSWRACGATKWPSLLAGGFDGAMEALCTSPNPYCQRRLGCLAPTWKPHAQVRCPMCFHVGLHNLSGYTSRNCFSHDMMQDCSPAVGWHLCFDVLLALIDSTLNPFSVRLCWNARPWAHGIAHSEWRVPFSTQDRRLSDSPAKMPRTAPCRHLRSGFLFVPSWIELLAHLSCITERQ